MNKVILMGRLTRDPEVRYTNGEKPICIARYSLAVDRRYQRDDEATTDFISCVAFGKGAEFAEKYLYKGSKILIVGRIQTGSYTNKDGHKVYTTNVVVDEHEFVESRSSGNSNAGGHGRTSAAQESGGNVYTTDVVVDEHEFVESRSSGNSNAGGHGRTSAAQESGGNTNNPARNTRNQNAGGYNGYSNQPPQAQNNGGYASQGYDPRSDGFMNIPEGIDDELPFN